MRKLFSFLFVFSATTAAFAHEGHGHTEGFTITHYFTEPEHVIPLLLAVAVVIWMVTRYRKAIIKK